MAAPRDRSGKWRAVLAGFAWLIGAALCLLAIGLNRNYDGVVNAWDCCACLGVVGFTVAAVLAWRRAASGKD